MVFASIGRNSRCMSGAKLTSKPLTEASFHAEDPAYILEVVWMPSVLLARKFADAWVKPTVNWTNW